MRDKATFIALALLMPLAAWAQSPFDSGGDNLKPWDHFKLPKSTIKLDLGNANADAVVSVFEKLSGISIVKDPTLVGKLPITSAKAVSVDTAFQILSINLSLKGYSLEREDNLLVIRQKPKDGGPGGGNGNGFQFGGRTGGDFGGGGEDMTQHLETYFIKFANATQVAKVLNDVFTTTPGTNNNQGGFPGFGGGGRFGRFQQQNNQPAQAAPTDGGGGFGRRTPPPLRASPDDYSNTVIVNGTRAQQDEVKKIITKIDTKTDQPQTSKVYRLTYASATDLASVVQNVLVSNAPLGRGGQTSQNSDPGQRFQQALRLGSSQASFGQVAVDARTNSLVVTATEDNQATIETIVRELDTPVDIQTTTFVFPLENAKATDVANLLLGAFGQRQGVSNTNRTTTSSNTHTTTIQGSTGSSSSSATGNRSPTLGGEVLPGDLVAGINEPIINGQPTAVSDASKIATSPDGQSIPVELADPNATSGELLTEVGVTQGFGGGFFGGGRPGGGGNAGQFGGSGSQSTNQSTTTTGRDANGQLINIRDLTGQVTAIPDPNTNSIVIVTTPDGAQIIKNVLKQLDRIPQQVVIQTMIVEASLTKADQLGVEWESVANKVLNTTGATGTGVTDFGLQSASPLPQGLRYTLTSANLDVFVNALKTDTNFRVLSTPRIFTSNNITAQINVSQSIPYVVSSVQDPTTGTFTYNYEFLDVGIVLTVTPQITSNGYVTMDVTQTANTLQGYTSFNAPIVNQRTATTTVSVKDTETVILGGLIQDQISSTVNKVPILGDIPILGHLFRSSSKSDARTELLVFMTPRIINNNADARKATDIAIQQLGKDTRDLIRKSTQNGVIDPSLIPSGTPKVVPPIVTPGMTPNNGAPKGGAPSNGTNGNGGQ